MRKAVEELKRQNINKIIAIGHSGIDIDQKVAKEVEGVDIVVGGHEHALLYTGKQRSLTFECQVCSRAKFNKNSKISFCKILKTNSAT